VLTQESIPVRRPSRVAGTAALLGGAAWLLLAPAAELHRRDLLTYDAYNRLIAVPLLLFTVALVLAPRVLAARGLARAGLTVAAVGAGLLLAGNVVEFCGVLLQDRPNAYAAYGSDLEPWIGSDVGWLVFLFGALVLLIGGILAAVGMTRAGMQPRWLVAFAAALGPGVLAGNLFGLGPALISVSALAAYAAAWLMFGRLVLR
jgi:hypothetical protein